VVEVEVEEQVQDLDQEELVVLVVEEMGVMLILLEIIVQLEANNQAHLILAAEVAVKELQAEIVLEAAAQESLL
tara:strand:+ start:741 stop:962 length:222 start_codon:yes stop_codon:yes gene_type:complete